MKLLLKALPPTTRGIYATDAGPDTLPKRFRWLHPKAQAGFMAMEFATGGLTYSDVLRSAEESLHAMQVKSGVKPPGMSGHNFGFSVDVAVEATMKLRGWTYETLLDKMAYHGWHCHRRDRASGKSESWHFNYFGDEAPHYLEYIKVRGAWDAPLEQLIQDMYGPEFVLDVAATQAALRQLHMYAGDIDGLMGPLTRQGLAAFQRAWLCTNENVSRVLAFVTAERVEVP